jgi:hypothetical protein
MLGTFHGGAGGYRLMLFPLGNIWLFEKCSRGKHGKLKLPLAILSPMATPKLHDRKQVFIGRFPCELSLAILTITVSTRINTIKNSPTQMGSAVFGGAGGYCPRVQWLTTLHIYKLILFRVLKVKMAKQTKYFY